MTSVQALVSTMDLEDPSELLERMRLHGPSVIVNQTRDVLPPVSQQFVGDSLIVHSDQRGLSRSRNLALAHATGDICILADDDEVFGETYVERIATAFAARPESDVIVFSVHDRATLRKSPLRASSLSRPQLMQVSSVQIAFRRATVMDSGVLFDEDFGAGSTFPLGEELIFLSDVRRLGLRISAIPLEIAHLEPGPSSWFHGYDEGFFKARGASFARADSALGSAYTLQWAVRKRRLYGHDASVRQAVQWMSAGAREWKHGVRQSG